MWMDFTLFSAESPLFGSISGFRNFCLENDTMISLLVAYHED